LYLQLLIAYKIYDFVVMKRKNLKDVDDFIYSADELMSYAIFKKLKNSNKLQLNLDIQELESIYCIQFDNIKSIVRKEKELKEKVNSTYSHNDYFKSEKSIYDLLEINGWSEDSNKVLFLNSLEELGIKE